MRRLSTRERLLVTLAGVALVVFALAFAVILPMADRVSGLARDETALRKAIAEAAKMYEAAPAIRAETEDLRAEVSRLMFPRENVKVQVVHEIDRLTSDLGIRLANVKPPGEPESLADCLKYTTSFTVTSTFAESVRLLYELEQPGCRLWVEKVDIERGRGAGAELQINVQVAAYVAAKAGEEDDVRA
ncbi:MAG: type II secretion system protein M [Armatimonadota bacterium]|nr:MAG: type II secretion system protein M [Armatimonadota bacterium]